MYGPCNPRARWVNSKHFCHGFFPSLFSQCCYETAAVISMPKMERLLPSPGFVCVISESCFCLGLHIKICERSLLVTALWSTGAAPCVWWNRSSPAHTWGISACLPSSQILPGEVAALTMRSSSVFLSFWCLDGSSVQVLFSSYSLCCFQSFV